MNMPTKLFRHEPISALMRAGLFLGILLVTGCMDAEIRDLEQFTQQARQQPAPQPLNPLPEINDYLPFSYNAEGLRDPFALSRFVTDVTSRRDPVVDSGIRPDTDRPVEELEKYQLNALRLVGTFQDLDTQGRWALIRAPDGIVHRVRIGNYIGQNFGEIYNVTSDRVEIQEIVRDPATGVWRERPNVLSLVQ